MSDFTHIAFTDLETTGLNERTGDILEIGIVLTDRNLDVIGEYSSLVCPPKLDMLAIHPVVRKMHTNNGLFTALFAAIAYDDKHQGYDETQRDAHAPNNLACAHNVSTWIMEQLPGTRPGDIALGGSGVSHFDARWLDKHMPELAKWFYRSTVDIGVIRRFIENVANVPDLVPQANRMLNHRALDDAHNHHAEAIWYRDLLRGMSFIDANVRR